MIICIKTSWF